MRYDMQFGKTKNIFIAAAGMSITDNLPVYFQVGYYCCIKKYQVALLYFMLMVLIKLWQDF